VSSSALLAAGCVAGLVGLVGWRLARPRREIARRMGPYTEVARSHLGVRVESLPQPLLYGEVLRRVLGPLTVVVSSRLARLLRVSDTEALELKLRRAGQPMTVEVYRRRHLRWAVGAPVVSAAVGLLLGSSALVVVFAVGGAVIGLRRMPDRLASLTRLRTARMRSDLPTVAWVLSPKIANRKSLIVAVSEVVAEGSGPVVDDLARALHLIAAGYGDAAAFNVIARESPEEAAARFYRFLAAATGGGIDLPQALLDHAEQLRVQRREEVERTAAKRQMSMVIPDLAFMAPVLILFLLAPLPRLLFGH
jgi:tight adherence protein C